MSNTLLLTMTIFIVFGSSLPVTSPSAAAALPNSASQVDSLLAGDSPTATAHSVQERGSNVGASLSSRREKPRPWCCPKCFISDESVTTEPSTEVGARKKLRNLTSFVDETLEDIVELFHMYNKSTATSKMSLKYDDADKRPCRRSSPMLRFLRRERNSSRADLTLRKVTETLRDGVQVIMATFHAAEYLEKKDARTAYKDKISSIISISTSSGLYTILCKIEEVVNANSWNLPKGCDRCRQNPTQKCRLRRARSYFNSTGSGSRFPLTTKMPTFLNAAQTFFGQLNGLLRQQLSKKCKNNRGSRYSHLRKS